MMKLFFYNRLSKTLIKVMVYSLLMNYLYESYGGRLEEFSAL